METRVPFMRVVFLGCLIVFSCLAGCATVDQKIGLSYSPVDRNFGRHNGKIAVSRIDTTASAKNSLGEWVIGSLNNANGVHRADILADRSLGEWITDALLLELKHAGYTATYTASLPSSAPYGVLVTDINVSMNVDKGMFSDEAKEVLKFNVEVFLNGIKAKTFTVASRNSKTLFSSSQEAKEKIMLQSLQDAMQQIVPDMIALIEKK